MLYTYLLILLPLLGFLINGLLGKKLSKTLSGIIGSGVILGSFIISCIFFFALVGGQASIEAKIFDWISVGSFHIEFGVLIDQLSAIWLMVVTGIGFLIHVYSIGYMHDDEGFQRFFSYLNLFIFFMLLLVLGSNFVVMFIGWEGVGLCSYLLIGFWYKNQDYNDAAKKAFVMNRIGDLGFLIGMFILLYNYHTLSFTGLQAAVAGGADHSVMFWATLFLFIGACGKSAQIPLYTWLPDAMAGPTPVSALIHAATMVTAGIFMICRANFLFTLAPDTLYIIAIVGVVTALFAATIGVMQNDIKKVLAYSTVSQLGLMFVALGFGAYSTGAFHVVTHAFFKACLFLGSGSVIHAMGGEQDIRRMGGLKKWMPVTFATFLVATIAISGIPPFAGFFSKDEILAKAYEHNKVIWGIASFASMLTAFYMFRLVFLTFFTSFRGTHEQEHHLHESPATITFPLIVLAILSVVGGLIGLPPVISANHWLQNFLSPVFAASQGHAAEASELSHGTEWMLIGIATAAAVISIAWAYTRFIIKKTLPAEEGKLTGFASLVYHKYYVDEAYNVIVVKPLLAVSEWGYEVLDKIVVDGVVVWSGKLSLMTGKQLRQLQSGNIGFYLLMMVLGIIGIFIYVLTYLQ
ncbi:MAG: NADH:ubiquinone oxidoreductase subunit [Bacteroidetes bacterium]|nr:NADH:ubiquinone oxidoreductase subunit [Bacteroidota bacterium]